MKFSIVTPVLNGERHIAETVESVLSQEGDFEIEYVVQDGGSQDGTMPIVHAYEKRLADGSYPLRCRSVHMRSVSGSDDGMYDAIEQGFAGTDGDVMAYLNADDCYLPGAYAAVAAIFASYGDVQWVKGVNVTASEDGTITRTGDCFIYRQDWLVAGVYGRSAPFVQQDSVFWRRGLWDAAQPRLRAYRLAGDYALWITFARHAALWSFDQRVSVFRKRPGQLSEHMAPYRAEQDRIAPRRFLLEKRVALYFTLARAFRLAPASAPARALYRIFFPCSPGWWYIGFDPAGRPEKKHSASYVV